MNELPDERIYYAQNREDLILESFFKDVKNGFYVDVGACHPHVASVTKRFYLQGWKGINIEPQIALHDLFNEERKRDINLNIGISDSDKNLVLRTYMNNRGLSTIAAEMKREYEGSEGNKTEDYEDTTVKITTLKSVLSHYKPKTIHFLKVDVEGYEYEVLNGNDWSQFRPEIICIEANHVIKDWRALLKKNGYVQIFFDGLNEYYVDEKTDRVKKFDYVNHVLLELKGGIAADDYDRQEDFKSKNKESEKSINNLQTYIENQSKELVSIKRLIKRTARLTVSRTKSKFVKSDQLSRPEGYRPIAKKLLMVSNYPIYKPLHGGQKRASAIFNFYKQNFSEAKYVGVFHRGHYPDWDEGDILLGQPDVIKKIDENLQETELIVGKAIDNDIHVRSHMAKLLMEYKPDIIHIEQPFIYLGLKILLAELSMSPAIIYGSQNIEYKLKKRIYKNQNKLPKNLEEIIEATKALEIQVSQESDLVIAVNATDAEFYHKIGSKKCIVVPNGVMATNPSAEAIDYWQKIKKDKNIKNVVTFVGSGHPPNWAGFLEMVGNETTFMPKGSKIFIAGGVSNYFRNQYHDSKKYADFWSGVELVGELSEDLLAGLLTVSDIFLLPIGPGGGSNLKTAEAILTNKKIVATTYAFNGFEAYKKLPNMYIASKQPEFKKAILHALTAKYVKPKARHKKLSKRVQWYYCFIPLSKALDSMIYGKFRSVSRRIKHKVSN